MRNKLLAVTTVLGLGLFTIGSVQAQPPPGSQSQTDTLTVKPCVQVYGAVHSPSRFVLKRSVRLAEALAMAGGANDQASETIQVFHATAVNCEQQQQQEGQVVKACVDCRMNDIQPPPDMDSYQLSQLRGEDERGNPYLQHGDTVLVVEAPPVYVIGNVLAPQAIYLKGSMTLTQALAKAGGVLRDSNIKKIRIIRSKSESTREEIVVDWNVIKKGRSEDLILEPYDIIDVPPKRSVHRNFLFNQRQLPVRVIT